LFVATEPTASRTAGHVKFSEAISSISPRCRSSSSARRPAISGSISSSPACFSSSNVACFVAIARMLLGEGAGTLPQDARLRPGEVDHRGWDPGKLADVDDRAAGGPDLAGDVANAARIGRSGAIGARRCHDADGADDVRRLLWQVRDANADGVDDEGV